MDWILTSVFNHCIKELTVQLKLAANLGKYVVYVHCSQHGVLTLTLSSYKCDPLNKSCPSITVLNGGHKLATNWKCDKWLQLTLYHVSLLTHSFQCKPVSILHKSPAWTDSSKGCYHTLCSNVMQVHWSWYYCNAQYFTCTLLLQILQVPIASEIKDCNNWTYWFMGVAHRGCGYNKRLQWSLHHWVKSGRVVPTAVMEVSTTL